MVVPPRERTTTSGWFAVACQLTAFLLISIAMFTRSWLAAESKAYGTSLDKLGLWWQCFRSFSVPKDIHGERLFVGCRWIFDRFTTGYEDVRELLATPFFVVVQVFYTLCFVLSLVGGAMSMILILCPGESFEKKVLKTAYIAGAIAFFTGFLAVVIFGAMAPMEGWMPHPDHNNLSWSYALAVVGVVAQFAAALLFWLEFRIQRRKDSYINAHGSLPMETKA
ncbi:uncharacterized protein LOC108675284 isoform X2 [Hyalella azteca]|uniref:Uncharacterized protein LOC108675284 isoform X2 n=2 Tax=Hyalella azteca TaxID=294128 RepID=A0A8B7P117_HYAAZ|nr:uncharacterized protein LOC108675284 isoform X2 [Hyalella azteca]